MYRFSLLLLLFPILNFSQGEANNWYFGNNAGITFSTSPPSALSDGQLATNEGCSSISDASGNLLFYTDGRTVWDREHNIMPNADYFGGTGLNGDPSSTSSGLIVPHPSDNDLYYVFTVDEPHHDNANAYPNQGPANPDGSPASNYSDISSHSVPQDDDGFNNGLNFSIVDMSLRNGLGDVVAGERNNQLITYDENDVEQVKYKCSEKITAVRGSDCSSTWLITHFIDTFYAFKIDDDGVDEQPVISQTGPVVPLSGYRRSALGYLKASPDGGKLITANNTTNYDQIGTSDAGDGNVYLFDFNNDTGQVSNPIPLVQNVNAYGVEFSPDATKAYATINPSPSTFSLIQWDLEAADISSAQSAIDGVSGGTPTAMQLGPDGKIYKTVFGNNVLAVINNPNADADNVNYTESPGQGAIPLSGSSTFGLPPFTQSIFSSRIDIIEDVSDEIITDTQICGNETIELAYDDISGATYTWYNEGELMNESGPQITVQAPDNIELPFEETFTLEVNLNDGSCPLQGIANITYAEIPLANDADLFNCVTDLENETSQFDLTDAEDELTPDNAQLADYSFTYFTNLSDAQAEQDPIQGINDYTNTSNPQTLYVSVNNDNTNCADIVELDLQIEDVNILNEQLNLCDTNEDGIRSFDLTDIDASSSLDVTDFYLTENEALQETNPIQNPTDFTITNPYQQDIYFRNVRSGGCDDLGILTLNIDELPPVGQDDEVIYCTNTFPEPINLTSNYVGLTNGFSFLWEPTAQTSPQIAINEAGEYIFTVLDESTGCQKSRTFTVLPSNIAFFDIEVQEFQANNTAEVILLPESLGDYEYAIDNVNGPYQDSNTFDRIPMGLHTIYVKDKNGCGIRPKEFGVLGIPEYFTPNQDGYNDYWQLDGLFKDSDFDAIIKVFDRYGKLLKTFSPRSKGWDGTYNGNPMPSNDYWYRVELADGKVFKGHFTLKR